jgi:hypothetical protein
VIACLLLLLHVLVGAQEQQKPRGCLQQQHLHLVKLAKLVIFTLLFLAAVCCCMCL